MQEGLYGCFCTSLARACLDKQFFETSFTKAPLSADLNAGYFTLTNKAVQGTLLDLQKLRGVAYVQDIVRHCTTLLFGCSPNSFGLICKYIGIAGVNFTAIFNVF